MSGPLKISRFGGLLPRVPETSLPVNAAVIAENIDFGYGELVSLQGDYKLRDLSIAARSIFSDDGLRFFAWPEDVNCVVSPMQSGAASDRLYYTTANDFRVTQMALATVAGAPPSNSYRVGVPRPSIAPAVTVTHPPTPAVGIAKVDAAPADTYATRLAAAQAALAATVEANTKITTETRVYAYSYRNVYNESGPPSVPVTVEVKAITYNKETVYSTVTVEVNFDGSGPYVPIMSADVYRTSGAATTDDYYFAFSVSGSAGPVAKVDNVPAGSLNEPLSGFDAYPPDPLLTGLVNIGNGILAAFKGRELWFSDAYRPWSWPPSYMKAFRHPIVGLHPHGAGALVTTMSEPSLISGISPDAMSEIPLSIPQAGVSKWAMLSLNGIAIYACQDGIVAINGGQPDLSLSERYFTRKVWRQRYGAGLSSMEFAHYDGRVVVFSKSNAFVPFMLQLEEGKGEMTDLPNLVAQTSLVLTTSDQMYTVNGTSLNQFGGGAARPLRWKSGDIVLPGPRVLAVAQAECVGTFQVKFYQAGKLGYSVTLQTGKTTFRLPAEPYMEHAGLQPSDRWQFEISGTGTFKWLKAGVSAREFSESK